ncbi:MAG: DNA polymerase IV [Verrucomicrobia bacterium]|nr:DNA polymerase IV [Verrucomicrobiota bacterium]MDA1086119.1 DNA polymerase IV [Verrucomicrobiota bacterium]
MTESGPGTILHIDMDAFYASIEQLDAPELRGKPVVVGAPPDRRGVVATASYEARAFGVRSAMPSRTAYKLCPQATFVPVRMSRYADVSRMLMELLHRYTPIVEKISVDEAFMDVSGSMRLWPDPVKLAQDLTSSVRRDLELTASVGVAPNKFLAKLASDMQKPAGLTVAPVDPKEIIEFLAPMDIRAIWGIGERTAERLRKAGIHSVGQLQQRSEAGLRSLVGESMAHHIHRLSLGVDDRRVTPGTVEKSISNEHTFDVDCADPGKVERRLIELVQNVGTRLRRSGKLARTAQIKIRFADFRTITRQGPLDPPGAGERVLIQLAKDLWAAQHVTEPVRLVGFGVANLSADDEDPPQHELELFPELTGRPQAELDEKLDQAVDELRNKFGKNALRRGGLSG